MRISDWSSDVCSSDLKLQVFHLLPVDYLGEQVQPKLLHDIFDILDGDPGIPTSVDMEDKRPQLHLSDGNMQHIGAIEPPAHPEIADEPPLFAIGTDLVRDPYTTSDERRSRNEWISRCRARWTRE